MTTESELYQVLMLHNAFTKNSILDVDSLGAGGSKMHLIIYNTQRNLTHLKTNKELIEVINSIGNFESFNGQTFDQPNTIFYDEYQRLRNGGKVNNQFMKYLDIHGWLSKPYESRKYITGESIREAELN